MDSRILSALRSLGAEFDRLSEIPRDLQQWIARLTPEDLERIRKDLRELERVGQRSTGSNGPDPRNS